MSDLNTNHDKSSAQDQAFSSGATDSLPVAGALVLVAVAAILLATLMVWQAWQDFHLLRTQHQVQVE
jgi:hypothetical protein